MSTRSGKRIHSSFIEEEIKISEVLKPKRKTRNNKLKENCDIVETVVKKKHFVRYPSEDDVDSIADWPPEATKSVHKPQRKTLQEINGFGSEDSDIEKKPIRPTRRTKKIEEEIISNEIPLQEVTKKSKKKNKVSLTDGGSKNENGKIKKVSKKKKKKRSSIIEEENDSIEPLNKSNMSVDSFHSAAGSTLENLNNLMNQKGESSPKLLEPFNECHVNKSVSPLKQLEDHKVVNLITINETEQKCINHVEKKIKKKKSKKTSFNTENKDAVEITLSEAPIHTEITEIIHDKKAKKKSKISKNIVATENIETILNSTFEKEKPIGKASVQNSTFEKIIEIPIAKISTEEKVNNQIKRKSSLVLINNSNEMNSSKEQKPNGSLKSLNSTYDKTPDSQKKISNQQETALNTTFEKECTKLDVTFEKDKQNPLNSTFEKSNEKVNLDTTFDKESASSKKSSLLSSDRSIMTDDKSNNSRISISDDSRDNIVNTTPMLIESSLERSFVKQTSPEQDKTESQSKVSPHTPLKREGTFTKESNSPLAKSAEKTPSKRASVASPGRTPFPFSKSSSKDKSMLNVTRSIEKSRRSSLIDLPRATKVMFCSPVNNPVIINQMKGKVIKSNLKGSNKSFVFNESVSDAVPSARKRSYTQSDADDVSVKRKRLADELQQSVDRLSRPRTASASAKLQDTTPSKNTPQKSKEKVSRTKLPNFAALHQKQFSKMESLDECQERKAKRARRMLARADSGGRLPSPIRKDSKAKKTETPVKTRLPTLESLNPGYTRFGFKMNSDVNPFANSTMNGVKTDISTKTNLNSTKIDLNSTKSDIFKISTADANPFMNMTNTHTLKPKRNEMKRQTALPSLAGSTVRKEMAKQTIMREKSFTERANVNRKENRTIIKGVRTNRRFELQMKLRNIN
ncbi:putative leucine-rich repeat-containing protein DDB_G0290503 [Zerene cesonia]|uniref:putative leucine-rich repeat-containing protein DDB_G0290503 n=1 Tax=Zerene cesonia TaxID=33412 RepID=UPI0018E54C0B|nr:putative leucine-rich repeat-containing protein DDB_G0290503 [Zerene cesonia]